MTTWTSYRDGRRVMHYIEDGKGRFYVQKVADGYRVSAYSSADKWTQVLMTTAPTLAAGKKWVEDHIAAQEAVGQLTLAEIKAKLDDEPMYECEIPGTPGRVTRGGVDITPGVHTVKLTGAQDDGRGGISLGFEVIDSRPYQSQAIEGRVNGILARTVWMQLDNPGYRIRPHRPATYNSITLGIDSFKAVRMRGVSRQEQYVQLLAQDARVCRIEQELVQYAGKRRTPHRDRKVAKLRKILRILKRGLYV